MSDGMAVADPLGPIVEVLLGRPVFTTLEVAREAGVDPARARLLWRALGFPPVTSDERLFTGADVEILRAVRALVELDRVDPTDLLQLTRVVGQSLARVADAQVTTIAERLEPDPERGMDEEDLGRVVQRIEGLAPNLEQFLGYVWRRHLLAALRRLAARPSAADRTLAVGFADLVGFTTMSQALDTSELAAIIDRFEAVAYEHIPERGG